MKFEDCPNDDEQAREWLRAMLGSIPSDYVRRSLAAAVWPITYGAHAAGLDGKWNGTADEWAATASEGLTEMLSGTVQPGSAAHLACLAKWADGAYTQIVVGEKLAAAMMATSANIGAAEGIRLPWASFVVTVPGGLLGVYDRISFMSLDFTAPKSAKAALSIHSSHAFAETILCKTASVATCLFELDPGGLVGFGPLGDADHRILLLARRLVVGCLFQALYGSVKQTLYPMRAPRGEGRSGPPAHRIVVVGAPIELDVREQVRDFVSGATDRRVPTVQTLVRGHYRNQACGVGMKEHKVIWIEPHWRGPEEALIKRKDYVTQ